MLTEAKGSTILGNFALQTNRKTKNNKKIKWLKTIKEKYAIQLICQCQ